MGIVSCANLLHDAGADRRRGQAGERRNSRRLMPVPGLEQGIVSVWPSSLKVPDSPGADPQRLRAEAIDIERHNRLMRHMRHVARCGAGFQPGRCRLRVQWTKPLARWRTIPNRGSAAPHSSSGCRNWAGVRGGTSSYASRRTKKSMQARSHSRSGPSGTPANAELWNSRAAASANSAAAPCAHWMLPPLVMI
jgi:hypothetical protein